MDRLGVALLLLVLVIVASDVAQPPGQVYWNKVLPNTPMPRAIRNMLKRAGDNLRKQSGTIMHKDSLTIDDTFRPWSMVGNGTKTRYDPDITIFFLGKDLQTGTRMTLHFYDPTISSAPFISRSEASLLPFTSSKLPEILNHFSIQPNSNDAETMRNTLTECEMPAIEGEKKHCATSLESMIDFSTTTLDSRDVLAQSPTAVDRENSPKQQYEIISFRAQKKISGYSAVLCHASSYVYAVFFCHATEEAKMYQVSLVGMDGTRVEAMAICHPTYSWDPAFLALQMLGVKPGTGPICHFLPQNHVVWTPSFK